MLIYSCLKNVMKQLHANEAAANDDHNGSDVDDNNNSNDNNNNSNNNDGKRKSKQLAINSAYYADSVCCWE
jgi:hypothetical protein